VKWIEVGALSHFALGQSQERIECPEGQSREASQPTGDFEEVRHAVTEDEQRPLRTVIGARFAYQAATRAIVGQDGLQVPLKDEGALALAEEQPAGMRYASQRLSGERGVLPKILRRRWRPPRWTRVVTWVSETGEPLKQNFEFEQVLDFVVDVQVGKPSLARVGLLLAKAVAVATARKRTAT